MAAYVTADQIAAALLEMLPRTSEQDALNHPSGNRVLARDGDLTHGARWDSADGANVLLGEFRGRMLHAIGMSPLRHRIPDVVELRPAEQMGWTDTGSVVAVVAYHGERIQRNSMLQCERDSVRSSRQVTACDEPRLELTIAAADDAGGPEPAWAKLRAMGGRRAVPVNFGPEAGAECRGIINLHREPPTLGATPSAVCSSARALSRKVYQFAVTGCA